MNAVETFQSIRFIDFPDDQKYLSNAHLMYICREESELMGENEDTKNY